MSLNTLEVGRLVASHRTRICEAILRVILGASLHATIGEAVTDEQSSLIASLQRLSHTF